jgi:hypothetical protein
MSARTRGKVGRLRAALASDKQSVATGLVIGLIIWSLTRLVDTVTGSPTIEYDTQISPTVLADGSAGYKVDVTLTNLSHDTVIRNLRASVYGSKHLRFSSNPDDRKCAYGLPVWIQEPTCEAFSIGMNFSAQMLLPNTYVKFGVKYTRDAGSADEPLVRIGPEGESNLRLVERGLETLIVRHETGLLLGMIGLALAMLAASLVASVGRQDQEHETGGDTS